MIVVYSSDEKYARHTAASIASLLTHNTWAKELTVYVISTGMDEKSKDKIKETCQSFGREYVDIPFEPYIDRIKEYATWHSISAYARMFIPEMLPERCERALYLDCDTIIVDSLQALWELNLSGCCVAGVKDTINENIKRTIGMSEEDIYVNTGVLLLDLRKWRENAVQAMLVDYLKANADMAYYQDQSTINVVLKGQIYILPPKYNAMTTFFTLSYKRMLALYGLGYYYSPNEIREAASHPVVVHCTSGVVDRAWVKNSRHPFAKAYAEAKQLTPWKDEPLQESNLSLRDYLVRLYQMYFPLCLIRRF